MSLSVSCVIACGCAWLCGGGLCVGGSMSGRVIANIVADTLGMSERESDQLRVLLLKARG